MVDKVHEIFSFRQNKWLEKYISFNTHKRNETTNDFKKDFYKLMNNVFYRETMESVRNTLKINSLRS